MDGSNCQCDENQVSACGVHFGQEISKYWFWFGFRLLCEEGFFLRATVIKFIIQKLLLVVNLKIKQIRPTARHKEDEMFQKAKSVHIPASKCHSQCKISESFQGGF